MVILGSSSSGKTKFLRCLNPLERSERGQRRFPDLTIDFAVAPSKADIQHWRRKTSMVFQHFLSPIKAPRKTVMETPVVVQGQSWKQARQEALRLLWPRWGWPTGLTTSHQLRSAVGIIRALVLPQNFSA